MLNLDCRIYKCSLRVSLKFSAYVNTPKPNIWWQGDAHPLSLQQPPCEGNTKVLQGMWWKARWKLWQITDFYLPFSTSILPLRKSKKEILYLLETETGKLKTDGEDGLQEGLSDLFHRRNTKAKNNWVYCRYVEQTQPASPPQLTLRSAAAPDSVI